MDYVMQKKNEKFIFWSSKRFFSSNVPFKQAGCSLSYFTVHNKEFLWIPAKIEKSILSVIKIVLGQSWDSCNETIIYQLWLLKIIASFLRCVQRQIVADISFCKWMSFLSVLSKKKKNKCLNTEWYPFLQINVESIFFFSFRIISKAFANDIELTDFCTEQTIKSWVNFKDTS